MVYGAIDKKGESYYTYRGRVFAAIDNKQKEYNWLLTDCDCYPANSKTYAMLCQKYCWISGEELTKLVTEEDFQWVWAVLSAFDKSHSLSEVLSYPLPNAQDYNGFWDLPLAIQHPLAEIEIVPWDSSMTMIFSKRKDVVDSFRCHYPCSEDMGDYVRRLQAL